MSKTFKSAVTASGDRTLLVSTDIGMSSGFFLELQDKHEGCHPICFNNDTAPALALAILEAAGADSDLTWSGAKDYGNADHLGWIAGHLDAYIKTQERATAEAKEQAELESEALEFLNVYRSISGCEPLKEWRQAGGVQEHYLAIARHARTRRTRELRAEK